MGLQAFADKLHSEIRMRGRFVTESEAGNQKSTTQRCAGEKRTLINEEIRASKVRLIGPTGEQIGVVIQETHWPLLERMILILC